MLEEYLGHLDKYQHNAKATIVKRSGCVEKFLNSIPTLAYPSKIFSLKPTTIHDYVIKSSMDLSRASKKNLSSSLRSFLKFIFVCGYHSQNLVESVPVVTSWKLDKLPRGMDWNSVQKLLNVPDRKTRTGKRDHAILLIIATYGVRIGQIRALKLKDIYWRKGTINFPSSKGGKTLTFPLGEDIATALLDYISERKGVDFKEVFLTSTNTPQRPLGYNNNLSSTIRLYYEKAGIQSREKGLHQIRFALASKLVAENVSIKEIADILGHQSIRSTYIYTKVDVAKLRKFSRNWPGV